jgi:hypothetical protein
MAGQRKQDALLDGKAYSSGHKEPMLDLRYGGQMGYAPDLTEWVSQGTYVRKNLIPILLEAPRFFNLMPNPDKWVQSLKALVELHPKSIEGLAAGLTVETAETAVGGAGEMHEDFTNVVRARSQVSFAWVDKYGMPIQTFLHDWISYGLMDPDSKVANIGTLANYPKDMLPDQYSMCMMFIEPDPTHRTVQKAWIGCNMFPKATGDIVGKRDITAAGEQSELSIEFTGVYQTGLGVRDTAQKILDSINITNANPYLRPGFIDAISADVSKSIEGYKDRAETLGKTAIQRI